jgi:hypothetical protein
MPLCQENNIIITFPEDAAVWNIFSGGESLCFQNFTTFLNLDHNVLSQDLSQVIVNDKKVNDFVNQE